MPRNGHKGICIVAGGTGGHIMPALAVGEAVHRLAPGVPVKYVCGSKPLERDLYRTFSNEPLQVAVMPLYRTLSSRIQGAIKLMHSLLQSILILRRHAGVVLGMGSYVAAPVLAAARLLRLPYYIHEQNSVPGKTNRLFAARARKFFCAYPTALNENPAISCTHVGMPLRDAIVNADPACAAEFFNIKDTAPVMLVLGGSQGARWLNTLVLNFLNTIEPQLHQQEMNMHIIWSTGSRNYDFVRAKVSSMTLSHVNVRLFPFIEKVELAYAAASLALCRAGASTLAELAACRVPVLCVPLPHARDNHQYFNARYYADEGAGIVLEQDSLTPESLTRTVMELVTDKSRLDTMKAAAEKCARPGASDIIASSLLQEINNKDFS